MTAVLGRALARFAWLALFGLAVVTASAMASPATAATCPQLYTSFGLYNAVYDPATDTCVLGETPAPGGVQIGWFQNTQGPSFWNNHYSDPLVLVSSSVPPCAGFPDPALAEFDLGGNAGPPPCVAGTYIFSFVATTTAGVTLAFSGSFTCPSSCNFGGTLDLTIIGPPLPSAGNVPGAGVIANFMAVRAGQIAAGDPDLTGRLTTDGAGGGGGAPLAFAAEGTPDHASLAFATSLRRIASSGRSSGGLMGVGQGDSPGGATSGFDAWVEGKGVHVDDRTRGSNIGLLYAGIDYRANPNLVFGVMAQIDSTREKDDTLNTDAAGTGWLAGPYIVARLNQNLIFDGRAAWGQSTNSVSPAGTYSDSFAGERWLFKARFSGDFAAGAWSFRPNIAVSYFEERQRGYTDSLGNVVPTQTVAIGRLTFGPRVGYTWVRSDGTTVAPYAAINGAWDFRQAPIVDPTSGLVLRSGTLGARFEGGIGTTLVSGWKINFAGTYDVVAGGARAYGGSLRLSVPLN